MDAAFKKQMELLLGAEFPAFAAALETPAPVSIRWKTADNPGGTVRVPWHPQGFYLDERPVFTLDPLFHAGAYYVQEASSMFLYEALRQTVDFSKRLRVLDLCAAPGGKSTLLASMLRPDDLLLANEVIRSRVGVLRENLEKWGKPNTAVCSGEAEDLAVLEGFFDVVVVDAPCSGEGMFRKDPDAEKEWSPAHVELCSGRQRRILAAAVECLAPGGVLVYSTCTFNRCENEDNTAWLCREFPLEYRPLNIPAEWGIAATEGGYHFYPHRVRGEGFFIAVFQKKQGETTAPSVPSAFRSLKPLPKNLRPQVDPWLREPESIRLYQLPDGEILALPATLEQDALVLDKALKMKWLGIHVGSVKGRDLVPAHTLALNDIMAQGLPALDLTREQALLYLKKETFDFPAETPVGWTLARYEGHNLGWMKILPNRMNNYLPPERRIRMQI